MNQTEHQATGAGESQCDKILARLRAAKGERVAMPELYRVSGAFAVHSRIADLRKRGHAIPPAETEVVDGTVHSYYRLFEDQKEAA